MTAPVFPNGQTITVLTQSVSGRDADGNSIAVFTQRTVVGAVVWPTAGTEQDGERDTVTSPMTALLPPGDLITAYDQVQLADGTYEVVGPPLRFSSPFSDLNPGVQVQLRKVTG